MKAQPPHREVPNSLNISDVLMMVNSSHNFHKIRCQRDGGEGPTDMECLKGTNQSCLRTDKWQTLATSHHCFWPSLGGTTHH